MQFNNVKLSRIYLVKRIVAKLVVLLMGIKIFRDVVLKFSLIPSEYADVEGIFYKLDVEREIENIYVINDLISKSVVKQYIDIGTNFGQFAKGILLNPSCKILIEPNPMLWGYISTSNPGSSLLKVGVVSEGEGKINFLIVPGNSGACRVVESASQIGSADNCTLVDVISIKTLVNQIGVKKLESSFVKIDIEGSEIDIIKSFVDVLPSEINPIFAFETLTSKNVYDAISLLPGYNFYEARFEYQGSKNKNYSSLLSLVKVFLTGCDTLNLQPLNQKCVSREFYSLVFCLPDYLDPYSSM